ncbi:tetratricopeptide repeat protein [Mariniblastus sp.]|nr:tetratricopeptide repeat protein [Mariniblastus sp.]
MPINFSRLKSVFITGLCCGTFCVGTLVLQATYNPAVGQDALNTLDEPAKPAETPVQQQAQQQEALKKQLGDALYKELEKLVPGDQVEGSAAAESLHGAVDAILQRKPDMALVILEQTVASNPGFPPAELMMAGLSFAAKDIANGARLLQTAAIKNPEHPAVYAAYGRLASASNRNVDAKVHFEKLLSLIDKVQDATAVAHYENEYLEGMGQIALRLKEYPLAKDLAKRLLERQPDSTNPLQLLARVAFDEGKLDESVEYLTKLREKKPGTRVPESAIGAWFDQQNDQANASEWFSKLPTAYPNDAAVQLEYAAWALRQEDIDSAAAAIAKAEAIKPSTPASKNLQGKIAFYQGKYNDAAAIFKSLYQENPRSAQIANMYILSLIESSDLENHLLASQLAPKVAQANPKDRVTLGTLGYVRLKKVGVNDQQKALFAQLAKTRDGRSPEVDYFLANYLKEVGNNKDARTVLEQASQYPRLFLYRKQAEQMKQALGVLPTP